MKKFTLIVLSIFLFLSIFILEFNIILSNNLSKTNITKIVDNINITDKNNESNNNSNENINYNRELDELYLLAKEHNIKEETVNNIINSKEVKEFISKYISYGTDNLLNINTINITNQEIEQDLNNTIQEYINNNQTSLSNKEQNDIKKFVNQYSYKVTEIIPNLTNTNNLIDKNILSFVRFILGNTLRIILIVTILILTLLIYLLQRKNKKWLLYLGNTFLVVTIFTFIFSISINPIFNLVSRHFSISNALINPFSRSIIKTFVTCSIVTIIISIILLVVYEKSKKTIKSR